jgi:hypothetical protein
MSRRVLIWLGCAGLLSFGDGCATRAPNPSAAPPPLPPGGGAPLLDDGQVAAARELFIAKCTSCHKYYPPSAYNETDWNTWMRKMSRKARLKPAQDAALRDYLSLFRR